MADVKVDFHWGWADEMSGVSSGVMPAGRLAYLRSHAALSGWTGSFLAGTNQEVEFSIDNFHERPGEPVPNHDGDYFGRAMDLVREEIEQHERLISDISEIRRILTGSTPQEFMAERGFGNLVTAYEVIRDKSTCSDEAVLKSLLASAKVVGFVVCENYEGGYYVKFTPQRKIKGLWSGEDGERRYPVISRDGEIAKIVSGGIAEFLGEQRPWVKIFNNHGDQGLVAFVVDEYSLEDAARLFCQHYGKAFPGFTQGVGKYTFGRYRITLYKGYYIPPVHTCEERPESEFGVSFKLRGAERGSRYRVNEERMVEITPDGGGSASVEVCGDDLVIVIHDINGETHRHVIGQFARPYDEN